MRDRFAIAWIVTILSVCTYLAYEVVRMDRLIDAGAKMSVSAKKFERPIDNRNEILILGDSLAYGVGVSEPEKSFAGLLAGQFKDKSIINNAEIGETTESLRRTLDNKLNTHYEQIYIIVGGNDIMRIHINVLSSSESLKSVVRRSSQLADQVFLITTGDFNNVSLSPWILKNVFGVRANIIRNSALELEKELRNFNYVDFKSAAIEKGEYKKLEAPDGYHLNEQGIRVLVTTMLDKKY